MLLIAIWVGWQERRYNTMQRKNNPAVVYCFRRSVTKNVDLCELSGGFMSSRRVVFVCANQLGTRDWNSFRRLETFSQKRAIDAHTLESDQLVLYKLHAVVRRVYMAGDKLTFKELDE